MTTTVKSLAKIAFASNRHRIKLPELPEELWLEIFRFASYFVIEDAPKLLSFPVISSKTLRKTKSSLLHLILVCKLWHRIGVPFLYEYIVISNGAGLRKTFRALHESPSNLGHRTRRLDIMQSFTIDEIEKEMFTSLLLLLPNLRVFIFKPRSFQLLPWLPQHVMALPNLQILDAQPFNDPEGHDGPQTLANGTIRSATIPAFYRRESIGHTLTLPNLRQVYMTSLWRGYNLRNLMSHSLDLHRSFQSVTSVLIGRDFIRSSTFTDPSLFNVISEFFPSVQYIGIQCYFADLNRFFSPVNGNTALHAPATVHTLGFIFCIPQAKNSTYRELCDTLSQIQGDALRVIRFGEGTVADLQRRPSVSALMNEMLRVKGWRMERGDMYV